jgi:rhodanese-related sulfurtransferase
MALVGALKVVEDDPNAVVVIIFPDNIFKYASSIIRHFPKMFSTLKQAASGSGEKEQMMKTMLDNSRNPYDTISIEDANKQLNSERKPLLLDVRDRLTYIKQHVTGAKNMPLEEIVDLVDELPKDREAPIITVCNRGNLSLSGLLMLKSLGYRNVRSMNGGTIGWAEKGLPINEEQA